MTTHVLRYAREFSLVELAEPAEPEAAIGRREYEFPKPPQQPLLGIGLAAA